MGKVVKSLAKLTVAAVAVGGVCYAFKDKIKESKVYKDYDVEGKIKKVKDTIKEKMPVFDNEEDYVEDDEIFFEDVDTSEVQRDYVSIVPSEEDAEEEALEAPAEDDTEETSEEASEDTEVPTIDL